MTRLTRTHAAALLILVVLLSALGGAALGWAGALMYNGDGAQSVLVMVPPSDCDEKQRTDM